MKLLGQCLFVVALAVSSCHAQESCVCSAHVLPFYAKTHVRISLQSIKDTSNTFDFVGLPVDESFTDRLSKLIPTQDSISNARSYYLVQCPSRSYSIVLDRSRIVSVDGVNYQYDSLLIETLTRSMPADVRERYLP